MTATMKSAAVIFGLAIPALAAPSMPLRVESCCTPIGVFGVPGTVSTGFYGLIKQLKDGQVRVGQTNLEDESKFCLDRTKFSMVDGNGFGCILAGEDEKQFQCDHGKPSLGGWNIGCEGIVTFRGNAHWSMCPTGDHDGYNIYPTALENQAGCIDITLVAGGCHSSCNTPTRNGPPSTPQSNPVRPNAAPYASNNATRPSLPTPHAPIRPNTPSTPITPSTPSRPTTASTPSAASAQNTPSCSPCSTFTRPSAPFSTPSRTEPFSYATAVTPIPGFTPRPETPDGSDSDGSDSDTDGSDSDAEEADSNAEEADSDAEEADSVDDGPSSDDEESDSNVEANESECPDELTGTWQFPHLLVPVDSEKPDTAPGTSLFGIVSVSVKSYFNFDIPASYSGKQCTAKFMFPEMTQLETSSFTLTGSGNVTAGWTHAVTEETSWNTAPECSKMDSFVFQPGNSYVLGERECKAGDRIGFVIESSADTWFKWFQDFNRCPIGLYLTAE